MIYFLNIAVILILSILNISFFSNLTVLGVAPLLPFFFVIGLTYFRKGFEPILLAALGGIILDFYSITPFGTYLLLFLLISAVIRLFYQEGMKEISLPGYFLFVVIGLILSYIIQVVVLSAGGVSIDFVGFLIPFGSYLLINAVWAFLFYFLQVWYFDRLKKIENKLKAR